MQCPPGLFDLRGRRASWPGWAPSGPGRRRRRGSCRGSRGRNACGRSGSGSPGASVTPSGSGSHPAVRSARVVRMCICRVRGGVEQADLAHREHLTGAGPVGDGQLDLGVGQCPGVGAAVLVDVGVLDELVLRRCRRWRLCARSGCRTRPRAGRRTASATSRRGRTRPAPGGRRRPWRAARGSAGAARRPARRPVGPSPPAADPRRRRRPRFPPWPGPGTSTAAHGFSRSGGCPDRRAHARRRSSTAACSGRSATCRAAIAAIQSPARPAAASSPILRRIVLTSGARSNPSTRPSAGGSIRVAPSARASPSRARNTPSHNIVSSE